MPMWIHVPDDVSKTPNQTISVQKFIIRTLARGAFEVLEFEEFALNTVSQLIQSNQTGFSVWK